MTSQNAKPRHSSVSKGKPQRQDDSIMGTNNSSIVSKRSVERLFHSKELQFFRYFVKKPQRRSPLINRGYWLRMKAVDYVVRQFLEQSSSKQKVVINLGCGYDPLPWQSMERYPSHCKDVKFVDIDYKDLMVKKRDVVSSTKELNSWLSNVELSDGNVVLRSDYYFQLGCDLRDLKILNETLASVLDLGKSTILLIAEVSITYMYVEAADALIEWAGRLPDARFCLLEQLLPDGTEHPFARTMMAHFIKLNTPLRAVVKYPTTTAQEARFRSLGWRHASARNLWQLWNDSHFITPQERVLLGTIEPFDEWEEFALFGCHYFLLVAETSAVAGSEFVSTKHAFADIETSCNNARLLVEVEMRYSENPKLQGSRRFGAVLPLRDSVTKQNRVGAFGGMGLVSRVNTYDVYSNDLKGSSSSNDHETSQVPSSRMCHTITDLGDTGALLVGGRTSPETALADCWLYHKWLDMWERVDDLPNPQYRHGAVNLGRGHALIAPGRTDSRTMSPDFSVWSRKLGWVKCIQDPVTVLLPSYGATFIVYKETVNEENPIQGLLAGGISDGGVLLEDVWEWELRDMSSKEPMITFKRAPDTISHPESRTDIARFGASVVKHHDETWIIGGIIKDELLIESKAFVLIDNQRHVYGTIISRSPSLTQQPLFIGSLLASTGDSLLVMGGSAVCFSFGTFWNKGCYTLQVLDCAGEGGKQSSIKTPKVWSFKHTITPAKPAGVRAEIPLLTSKKPMIRIPRVKLESEGHFDDVLRWAKPVILEGLNLGPCTNLWTSEYLKARIGSDHEVIVHEAKTQHMDFKSKNFAYSKVPFGDFIDRVNEGGKLYLRSLSAERPTELPADIARDFPTISNDFRIPPELAIVTENAHSCPLRISGRVIMWLHYDVMANVLCQIMGSKRLILFPPGDVKYLGFEAGASSSSINVFEDESFGPINTRPHEALLGPGDVLLLPPLWLHTACPSSGMSIAVNVFFRNLKSGYAAGKDIYGNRDLQAYEKGRQDISKIIKSFDGLPAHIRGFYLQRLIREFEEEAS